MKVLKPEDLVWCVNYLRHWARDCPLDKTLRVTYQAGIRLTFRQVRVEISTIVHH